MCGVIPVERIRPRAAYLVAPLAGRDRERPIQDRDATLPLVDRALREVQRDARPVRARHGRPVVVVHLEHHARALREQHADALGRLSRLVAGRPAGEPAGRGEAGPAEARVARPGIGAIELFRGGRRIHIRENMMDEFPIARRVLDLRHPAILGELRRDHEAAIDVAGARRHRVRLGHLEDVIGRPELPAVVEHERRRQRRAVSLGRARLDPAHQGRELAVREPARLEEVAETGYRLPGWHHAPLDGVTDVVLLVERVAVGEQRERRVLARSMARLAAGLENADDLVAEGRRLQSRRRRDERQDRQRGHEQKTSSHRAPPLPVW